MYVMYNKQKNKYPIKVWLSDNDVLEEECIEQATNLSNLPFLHKWVALMPDTHTGKGMPIGGIIAANDVIIPNAVGVDIGCGMAYLQTNLNADSLKHTMTGSGSLLQCIIGDILRNVPVGFKHHKAKQASTAIDVAIADQERYAFAKTLLPELDAGYYQIGTLGGGNHFIELQEDDEGKVGIMLHSGSRHLGHQICKHFHAIARKHNQEWFAAVPDEYQLAFLPVGSEEGQSYIAWMNLALDFAHENRKHMLQAVADVVEKSVKRHLGIQPQYSDEINCHHNYAALENHYDKNVWVHRKGAIRARLGERGIIPGAMGSYSYLVEGKGNVESFQSCSHGAGRLMSRTKAKASFSVEAVMNDLKGSGVVLGKAKKSDVAEESRYAYKNIDDVIANELDLITPVKRLKTIGVVKG
ncbi:RtcB family protein [Azotosporobacter soli]|uniref:RtcB family protein n=1 Tax=Azotosporobacter soli TaxID=3055040 RepID=UPI0031FE8661